MDECQARVNATSVMAPAPVVPVIEMPFGATKKDK